MDIKAAIVVLASVCCERGFSHMKEAKTERQEAVESKALVRASTAHPALLRRRTLEWRWRGRSSATRPSIGPHTARRTRATTPQFRR